MDVPDEPSENDGAAKPPAWKSLLGLISGRQPWYEMPLPVSGDELSRQVRYGRALARLQGAAARPLRVLVLVPDDDATALRAAVRLANLAATDPQHTVLQVVAVATGRPTVPDGDGVGGVLVVLTSGTRTAWELVGLAEACADADHQVIGAVVVHRTRSAGRRSAQTRAAEDVLAGSV